MSNSQNLSPALRQTIISFNEILKRKHKDLDVYLNKVKQTYDQFLHPQQIPYVCDCGKELSDIKKKGAHKKYQCSSKGHKIQKIAKKQKNGKKNKSQTKSFDQ